MGVVKPIGPITTDLSDLPPVDFFTCAIQKSVFYIIIRILSILCKNRAILVNLTLDRQFRYYIVPAYNYWKYCVKYAIGTTYNNTHLFL